jgi:hypothetical protein
MKPVKNNTWNEFLIRLVDIDRNISPELVKKIHDKLSLRLTQQTTFIFNLIVELSKYEHEVK